MPWNKKKSYNLLSQNTNSGNLNVGTYSKTKKKESNNSRITLGLVYSLPKQTNTEKLKRIL